MDIPQSKSLLPRWLTPILIIGPLALYLFSTAYGVLEVHGSTDTWIGLAAGRQILTLGEVPKTDTFSYTFNGKPWYNQNWLTHVYQYWLYSNISPNAVIYGTWTLSALVFFFTLLAAYWRSGTWLGATVAAAVVALGCRDFLSARPATTGFFCIAALWALICAIEGQRGKHRWWPIVLLLPLLLIWGNAHGSFVFGYGVLGLYVGHWFVVRTIRVRHSWMLSLAAVLVIIVVGGVMYSTFAPDARPNPPADLLTIAGRRLSFKKLRFVAVLLPLYAGYWTVVKLTRPRLAVSDRQIIGIVTVVIVAFVLTLELGPFGIHNFTHGDKVAGSELFRQVSEWNPPTTRQRHFPPVWRFWTILGVSIGMLLASVFVWLTTRGKPVEEEEENRNRLHISLFDVAVVAIGLSMTFWARRFAPIYFIYGAPVFLTGIIILTRRLRPNIKMYAKLGVAVCALLFTFVVGYETYTKAKKELVEYYARKPGFSLLERVTRFDTTPRTALEYLVRNDLSPKLLTEWTQGGPVMFFAPKAKVFMDGRAQQVYSEKHYAAYSFIVGDPTIPRASKIKALQSYGTEAVLLRRNAASHSLHTALEQARDWIPILRTVRYTLFMRRGSAPLRRVGELLRSGEEWRPEGPISLATRGFAWINTEPPDVGQAVRCWMGALRGDVRAGMICFRPLTQTLLELGRANDASRLISGYYSRLGKPTPGLSERQRNALLVVLKQCWRDIDEAAKNKKPSED